MIGIITYFDGTNYGTTLQAFALQRTLQKLGYENEIINFSPYAVTTKWEILSHRLKHPKLMISKLKFRTVHKDAMRLMKKREREFIAFIEDNLLIGEQEYHTDEEIIKNPPLYDGYIVGSDQTWNPYVAGNPDALYLSFVDNKGWKGTYAPSISITNFDKMQEERLRKLVRDFDYLSCREETGSELIRKATGKEVFTLIDPTMLLTAEEWMKYSGHERKSKKYILQYFLGDNKKHRECVNRIATCLNLDIISLPYSVMELLSKNGNNSYCGPEGFLDLINNATLVCTDSFHGTVFSTILKTPFISFEKHKSNDGKSENSRLRDLLSKFGLEKRLITSYEDIDFSMIFEMDSKKIDLILDTERNKAYSYLRGMIENEGKKKNRFSKNILSIGVDDNCYSCFACQYVCPVEAITMQEKKGRFLPSVDVSKCIYCGKCMTSCLTQNQEKKEFSGDAYIAYRKDTCERLKSSSGGVFKVIADQIIKEGGYVAGCIYDDELQPKHIVTNKEEYVDKMVGSKYAQSDMTDLYVEIQRLLKNGETVLFSGLPCQNKAIISQFGQYKRLLTIGLVCHGTMPRNVWRKYLVEEETLNGKIISCSMRDKRNGWSDYGLTFKYENGKESISYRKSDGHLLKCFTDGLMESERCLMCSVKGDKILADILLGDGWSGEAMFPGIDDGKGLSEIFVLSEKGKMLMDTINDQLVKKQCDFRKLYEDSPRIWSPENRHPNLVKFRKMLNREDVIYHDSLEKYARPSFFERAIWKIGKIVKKGENDVICNTRR